MMNKSRILNVDSTVVVACIAIAAMMLAIGYKYSRPARMPLPTAAPPTPMFEVVPKSSGTVIKSELTTSGFYWVTYLRDADNITTAGFATDRIATGTAVYLIEATPSYADHGLPARIGVVRPKLSNPGG